MRIHCSPHNMYAYTKIVANIEAVWCLTILNWSEGNIYSLTKIFSMISPSVFACLLIHDGEIAVCVHERVCVCFQLKMGIKLLTAVTSIKSHLHYTFDAFN